MRITYRTLEKLIAKMTDDQKDSDLTVEIPQYGESAECFSAELRIAGEGHDGGLDDGHPVIFAHNATDEEQKRLFDVNCIAEKIGLCEPLSHEGQSHWDLEITETRTYRVPVVVEAKTKEEAKDKARDGETVREGDAKFLEVIDRDLWPDA